MNSQPRRLVPLALAAALTCVGASADSDVEQADSLRFQEFFKDKKDAVKIWKDSDGKLDAGKRTDTIKAYDASAAGAAPASTPVAPTAAAATTTAIAPTAAEVGQRFEIRERYALGRSASTPYSAFYVIEALHQQSAQLCPRGWKKLAERSEPVEQDFFLYYEIECL